MSIAKKCLVIWYRRQILSTTALTTLSCTLLNITLKLINEDSRYLQAPEIVPSMFASVPTLIAWEAYFLHREECDPLQECHPASYRTIESINFRIPYPYRTFGPAPFFLSTCLSSSILIPLPSPLRELLSTWIRLWRASRAIAPCFPSFFCQEDTALVVTHIAAATYHSSFRIVGVSCCLAAKRKLKAAG